MVDVLANDTDADGGPIQVESVDASRTVGSVTLTSYGSVQYTPAPGYCNDATSGTGWGPDDTFDYRLNGGSWATVYVTVRCVFAPDGSGTLTTSDRRSCATAPAATRLPSPTRRRPGGILNGASRSRYRRAGRLPRRPRATPATSLTNTGTRSVPAARSSSPG